MKAPEVEPSAIEVHVSRKYGFSSVKICFTQNKITITAGMSCSRSTEEEIKTQDKIMTYLGFTESQIKALHYD